MKSIGKSIQKIRECRELSAAQVASTLGLSVEEYTFMELGQIPFGGFWLGEVCEILNVTFEDVFKVSIPQSFSKATPLRMNEPHKSVFDITLA